MIFLLILATIFSKIIRIFIRHRRDQEILMLRKELQVLKRQSKKPKFSNWDRLFFVSIFKANSRVIQNIITLKPSTIIAWHRKLVKKKWNYSKKGVGRPSIADDIRQLILQMKAANKLWGARKINGELRKLGIKVGKSTIAVILRDAGYTPKHWKHERTWLNFLTQGVRIATHILRDGIAL